MTSTAHRPLKSSKVSPNQVRLIGGRDRSRVLRFPDALGLRPTGSRIRETLFNWLGQTLVDQRCIDLFAGSGALGFEAASRGAARVVMCEVNRAAVQALNENRRLLRADASVVINSDCRAWLSSAKETFDIAFCDPPFDAQLHDSALRALLPRLHRESGVYVEAPTPVEELPIVKAHYRVLKVGRAGAVHFALVSPAPLAEAKETE